jgi:hypothetical protein
MSAARVLAGGVARAGGARLRVSPPYAFTVTNATRASAVLGTKSTSSARMFFKEALARNAEGALTAGGARTFAAADFR